MMKILITNDDGIKAEALAAWMVLSIFLSRF